jgi:meso-butanediol dehydrogenase/(S,S)-butanediol dehydrogenase/diacetyl reductase
MDGIDIAIVDLNEGKTNAVAKELQALARSATVFVADVTNRDQIYAAIVLTERELEEFDIIINNAWIPQMQPLAVVTPPDVETIFKVNIELVLRGI